MTGLLDAISEAAEWDEQMSEGKSLSEREEAVLQALELLTREKEDITWIKGTDLRERVCSILGQTPDQMGNAQWIGHVLEIGYNSLTTAVANIMSAASSTPSTAPNCWT